MASRFPTGIVYENLNLQHLLSLHYMDRLTVTQLLVSKEAIQDSFLFRFGKTKLAADGSLQLFFINVTTLHDEFISDHYGRGHWQSQSGILFSTVFLKGSGCGFDLQFVLFPQPGDDFSKMPSGLTSGIV